MTSKDRPSGALELGGEHDPGQGSGPLKRSPLSLAHWLAVDGVTLNNHSATLSGGRGSELSYAQVSDSQSRGVGNHLPVAIEVIGPLVSTPSGRHREILGSPALGNQRSFGETMYSRRPKPHPPPL